MRTLTSPGSIRARCAARAGFTLAEVAVTLLIVGLILVLMLEGLNGAKITAAHTRNLRLAQDLGIGFCFGTDSHGIEQIGPLMEESRQYLLENGVDAITGLTREDGQVVRRRFSLE